VLDLGVQLLVATPPKTRVPVVVVVDTLEAQTVLVEQEALVL
jgi:hypothetical protein